MAIAHDHYRSLGPVGIHPLTRASRRALQDVPILVRGRVVHWIDSKASFGDILVHETQGLKQFGGYVNRFGPGLVIYWMGFLEDLPCPPEASFPSLLFLFSQEHILAFLMDLNTSLWHLRLYMTLT